MNRFRSSRVSLSLLTAGALLPAALLGSPLSARAATAERPAELSDDAASLLVEAVQPIEDFHITPLHLLGLDDDRLRYLHGGREKQFSQTGGDLT